MAAPPSSHPPRRAYTYPHWSGVARSHLRSEYVKAEGELSQELETMLKTFFDKMDDDKNGEVSYDEAVKFWGKNFAKVNAKSMFNEVDEDGKKYLVGRVPCFLEERRGLWLLDGRPQGGGGDDAGGRLVGGFQRRPHDMMRSCSSLRLWRACESHAWLGESTRWFGRSPRGESRSKRRRGPRRYDGPGR